MSNMRPNHNFIERLFAASQAAASLRALRNEMEDGGDCEWSAQDIGRHAGNAFRLAEFLYDHEQQERAT